ncbi:hypothetical protein CLAIMM_09808 [Cladophialophora immunda]|nr:hypothetical protein CLAIMM_09808 [Cladophialophora immunda]
MVEKEEQRRAKKRAADRAAQRAHRQRTKDYIAHLQKTIEACRTDSQTDLVNKLLAQNEALHAEIERLRKLLANDRRVPRPIYINDSASSPDGCSSTSEEGRNQLRNGTSMQYTEPILTSTANGAGGTPGRVPHGFEVWPSANNASIQRTGEMATLDSEHFLGPESLEFSQNRVERPEDAGHTTERQRLDVLATQIEAPGFLEQVVSSRLATQIFDNMDDVEPRCKIWSAVNEILSKILHMDERQAEQAQSIHPGSVFLGIRDGWDTLDPDQQENLIVRILSEYDQQVWAGMDPINRLAIAHKNERLMKR